jgi:predicted nucleic acid-binding Zn ribbon protein
MNKPKKYNSRKNTTVSLKEVLGEILEQSHIKKGISETRAVNYWEKVMGKAIAGVTTNIFFRNGVLVVSINSSVVRNELVMIKNRIIAKMNEEIGSAVIKDIVFK